MITGICKQCGKTTTAKYKSQLKTFCSIKCANQWKWNNQRGRAKYYEFKCENCGKPVFVKHGDYRLKSNNWKYFCSRECSFKYHVGDKSTLTRKQITYIDKVCPICGKVFKTPKYIKNKCCCNEHSRISNAMTKFCQANGLDGLSYSEYLLARKEIEERRKSLKRKVNPSNLGVNYIGNEKEYMKLYNKKFRKRINEQNRRRFERNPLLRIKDNIRKAINTSIRKCAYQSRVFNLNQIIGCSCEALLYYISTKFKRGMSWGNYGEWHIDHIMPLFAAETEQEIYSLCKYTNLQPLWSHENNIKGCKIPNNIENAYNQGEGETD